MPLPGVPLETEGVLPHSPSCSFRCNPRSLRERGVQSSPGGVAAGDSDRRLPESFSQQDQPPQQHSGVQPTRREPRQPWVAAEPLPAPVKNPFPAGLRSGGIRRYLSGGNVGGEDKTAGEALLGLRGRRAGLPGHRQPGCAPSQALPVAARAQLAPGRSPGEHGPRSAPIRGRREPHLPQPAAAGALGGREPLGPQRKEGGCRNRGSLPHSPPRGGQESQTLPRPSHPRAPLRDHHLPTLPL